MKYIDSTISKMELTKPQKDAIRNRRCGIVQMSDEKFYLVGKNCDDTEIQLAKDGNIIHILIDNSPINLNPFVQENHVRIIYSLMYYRSSSLQQFLLKNKKDALLKIDYDKWYFVADRSCVINSLDSTNERRE